METEKTAGKVLRAGDSIAASEAARALGRIRSERKAESSRRNLEKRQRQGGPKTKDPLTLACTCGAGSDTEIGENHKTTCPRGRLLYQRAKIAAQKKEQQS